MKICGQCTKICPIVGKRHTSFDDFVYVVHLLNHTLHVDE